MRFLRRMTGRNLQISGILFALGTGCSSPAIAPTPEPTASPRPRAGRPTPVYPPFRTQTDFLSHSASASRRLFTTTYEKAPDPLKVGSTLFWGYGVLVIGAMIGLTLWRKRIHGFLAVVFWTLYLAVTLVGLVFLFLWPTLLVGALAGTLAVSTFLFAGVLNLPHDCQRRFTSRYPPRSACISTSKW